MKHYHEIGKPFKLKYGDKIYRLVAHECETREYEGEILRRTCRGCFFAMRRSGWCSGHEYHTYHCFWSNDDEAKCSPNVREDGKYIHYVQHTK